MEWEMTIEIIKVDQDPIHHIHSVLRQLREIQHEERFNRTRASRESAEITQFMMRFSEAARIS